MWRKINYLVHSFKMSRCVIKISLVIILKISYVVVYEMELTKIQSP